MPRDARTNCYLRALTTYRKNSTVRQIEQLVRIAREFGRGVANGDDARRICRVGTFYETVEETLAQNGFAPNTYRKNKRPFHPSPTALDRS